MLVSCVDKVNDGRSNLWWQQSLLRQLIIFFDPGVSPDICVFRSVRVRKNVVGIWASDVRLVDGNRMGVREAGRDADGVLENCWVAGDGVRWDGVSAVFRVDISLKSVEVRLDGMFLERFRHSVEAKESGECGGVKPKPLSILGVVGKPRA